MPTKVLFLTSSYPRSLEDTASVFLRYLAEHLTNSGVDVHVLAPADGARGTVVEGKVTVHRFRYFPAPWQGLAYGSGMLPNLKRSPALWLQVPFYLLATTWSFLRLRATQRFDLIHAHWILPQGLIGALARYVCRVPLIVTAHGADAFALRGRASRTLKRFVISRADAWTANTAATAKALASLGRLPKPHVIPMGVHVESFARGDPAQLRRTLTEGELLVLFVGRLVEKKGCQMLIQAFSLLPLHLRARATLWIVGDGDQRKGLEEAAQGLANERKIKFWGALPNQRLPDFYAAADVLVVPSVQDATGDTEGQGVVLLEAFAGRVCVLASRVGGIANVVRDNFTGLLVEPDDPRALAAGLETLLLDPELRATLADNAYAHVRERYGWRKVAGEFAALYQRLICSSGS